MTLIEALADSIHRFEGWIPPGVDPKFPRGSTAWRNRNPGNLRPIPGAIGVPMDTGGYRRFASMADGWTALVNDIKAKLSGASSHHLTNDSTLRNFFDIYAPSEDDNDPNKYARQVAAWLSRDLAVTIAPDTTLGYLKQLDRG